MPLAQMMGWRCQCPVKSSPERWRSLLWYKMEKGGLKYLRRHSSRSVCLFSHDNAESELYEQPWISTRLIVFFLSLFVQRIWCYQQPLPPHKHWNKIEKAWLHNKWLLCFSSFTNWTNELSNCDLWKLVDFVASPSFHQAPRKSNRLRSQHVIVAKLWNYNVTWGKKRLFFL